MDAATARTRLDKDGVVLLERVVDANTLALLREAARACGAGLKPMSRQVLYTHGPLPAGRPPLSAIIDQWLNPHRDRDACSTAAAAEALRPVAELLLGKKSVLFQDLLLVKRRGHKEFVWHQDFGFWPVDRPDGIILWVPLDGSDAKTGALRFAAGSHRLGARPVVDLHDGLPQSAGDRLGFAPDMFPVLAPTYTVGDAVAFSPLTFHSSPPMSREGERVAWSCVFLSPSVRWQHARAPNHPMCRQSVDGAEIEERT